MKDAWFVALCVIALFTIIEAKPRTHGSGSYDYDSYEGHMYGSGVGYGSGSYGAGGIGAGRPWINSHRGSGSSGRDMSGDRRGSVTRRPSWKWHSSEELEDLSFSKQMALRRSNLCSESGCISVGNGHHNTNTVDIVTK
ncbi:unnamed protein product, partial [Brenthis ino]